MEALSADCWASKTSIGKFPRFIARSEVDITTWVGITIGEKAQQTMQRDRDLSTLFS
jgi:hypothetical protein